MVDKGERSVYLDALRAFALARVVLYHATSMWTVTTFTAMPLMFFIAGTLYANSVDRRPTRQVIIDRYRRILYPYWLYVVAMVVLWAALGVLDEVNPLSWVSFAMPVLSLNGPVGPGAGTPVELTWIALWYLQMHLIFSLLGGWMRRQQSTHRRRFWLTLTLIAVVTVPIGLGVAFVYAMCWSLGYEQHDGRLESWLRTRWIWIAAFTGPIGLLAFLGFHNSNVAIAGLGAALLGGFWLTVALALRAPIEARLQGAAVRSVVHWFSARSLTIYMWHMVAVLAVVELELPGGGSAWGRLLWVVAFMPPVAIMVGWAEDLAARRRPQLWPRPSRIPPMQPDPRPSVRERGPSAIPGPRLATDESGPTPN